MATNKIALQSAIEFMNGYTPIYQPIYPLFLGKSQKYTESAGQIDFLRAETIGDIRGKRLTPKDNSVHEINSREGKKTFKKYFFGAQYIQSNLQDPRGLNDVTVQVLDEHQKQCDEIFSMGEGSANNNVVNNGLFWSGDSNHITNSSAGLAKDANSSYLSALHAKILSVATTQSDLISGRKVVLYYGSSTNDQFNSLYPVSNEAFKPQLSEVLGPNYSLVRMPINTVPANSEGFIIANLDQVMAHYMTLPVLAAQGINEEKMYSWHNFLQGSWMLEVLASGAIVKQDVTYTP